jgi:hypothetical protein
VLEKIAHEGMHGLEPAALQQGVPLGLYRVEDAQCAGPHKMILCKVALGRVLPSSDEPRETMDPETLLPTGCPLPSQL